MGCRGELQRKPKVVCWVASASCDSGEHGEVSGSLAIVAAPVNATVGSFVGFSGAVVSPVSAVIPASTREVSRSPVTAAVSVSATVGSFVGFSGAVVTDRRMVVVTHIQKAGDVNADASYNSLSFVGSR